MRPFVFWLVVAAAASVLPWYAVAPANAASSGLLLALGGSVAVLPVYAVLLALAGIGVGGGGGGRAAQRLAALASFAGAVWILVSSGLQGTPYDPALALTLSNQPAVGWGAGLTVVALLGLGATALARAGMMDGDRFGAHLLVLVCAILALFVLFPLAQILEAVSRPDETGSVLAGLAGRLGGREIWGLTCLVDGGRCGMVWNSVGLGTAVGLSATLLGLGASLFIVRTNAPMRGPLRLVTLLPLVTPPFVVGLALILLFGRSGSVTLFMYDVFDIRPSRWIYGPQGVWLAQTLGLTPLAFMVIHATLVSVSPSVEEAAQTLRAGRWYTFRTVTLPLIRPGLANAFLLCFIESLADLGNPLILGGGFRVLASGIYFKIVGAQADLGEAAGLGLILLAISLTVFLLQTVWLRGASFVTVTGKGDGGKFGELAPSLKLLVGGVTLIWGVLIVTVYGTVIAGSFAQIWGRDYSFTLTHYLDAFDVISGPHGLVWSGGAWNFFFTTMWIAAVAAPLTAALGLLTAYLIARRRFVGRGVFEFAAMMSFAMPGTVIGLAYVLSFNAPPIEITGTAVILIVAFISRNMPIGVRVGLAQFSQIDPSLDEASTTLGARPGMTLRRVLYPLMKPAVATAVIYAFVSSVTTLSQVIFLVSPRYDWATTYIIGLVENTNYGRAIAYSVVLIVLLIVIVALLQLILTRTEFRRVNTKSTGETQ
ncbi:iron ABC transporter permease [Acuticoccus sp. M5D2P5]|uniref:ABC transporter permease n=1 Tax=Acuticoccus kalidii TaxID=2910977 RepID=UPI001F3009A3|nr:iron ABC transporter permease [Acuticoccus kalidii]MCF3935682.1 iron ABC transporter permease [Acuticoccus kalidii]